MSQLHGHVTDLLDQVWFVHASAEELYVAPIWLVGDGAPDILKAARRRNWVSVLWRWFLQFLCPSYSGPERFPYRSGRGFFRLCRLGVLFIASACVFRFSQVDWPS